MTGSWEEFKRVELYDNLMKKLKELPKDKIKKIKKMLEEDEEM